MDKPASGEEHVWRRRLTLGFKGVLGAAALVSSVVVLVGVPIYVHGEWEDKHHWRDGEYRRLERLHAGYTRRRFEKELGVPVFDRLSKGGQFREESYRRREHWVQVVSDPSGTVVLYSVTACGDKFRPSFKLGTLSAPTDVTLNVSSLAEVTPRAVPPRLLNYFLPGATANSRFLENVGGGNPSNYKAYIYGVNDVCPDWDDLRHSWTRAAVIRDGARYRGTWEGRPHWVEDFRSTAVANTYAETAPFFSVGELHGAFQVGVDRILTRTIDTDD